MLAGGPHAPRRRHTERGARRRRHEGRHRTAARNRSYAALYRPRNETRVTSTWTASAPRGTIFGTRLPPQHFERRKGIELPSARARHRRRKPNELKSDGRHVSVEHAACERPHPPRGTESNRRWRPVKEHKPAPGRSPGQSSRPPSSGSSRRIGSPTRRSITPTANILCASRSTTRASCWPTATST